MADSSTILHQTYLANTPAILTSGGDVLVKNDYRGSWSIQNLGTNPLFVRMGTGASSTVFHWVLKGSSVADDGTGGSVAQENGTLYTGIISATGTSPRFVVMETN